MTRWCHVCGQFKPDVHRHRYRLSGAASGAGRHLPAGRPAQVVPASRFGRSMPAGSVPPVGMSTVAQSRPQERPSAGSPGE